MATKTTQLSEQHPREQGLKHMDEKVCNTWDKLSEQHPREQGLKLYGSIMLNSVLSLSEQHPREQGLKHGGFTLRKCFRNLSEQHPREQGLKLRTCIGIVLILCAFRATSKRTRIETQKHPFSCRA